MVTTPARPVAETRTGLVSRMMTELPETGRVRGRCVWWLSGQCKGGRRCLCLPEQRQEPRDELPDGPAAPKDTAGTDEPEAEPD